MPTSTQAVVSRTRFTHFRRAHGVNLVHSDSVGVPAISVSEPAGMVKVNEYVSAEIMFFGTDAANEAGTFDIYAIRVIGQDVERTDAFHGLPVFFPILMGSGTFILGTQTGVATGYLDNTQLIADTATFTPATAWEAYLDGLVGNSPFVFSPADNSAPALIGFPDLMNLWGVVIDINPGTAASANALISLWT